jgi:hypothetical protein
MDLPANCRLLIGATQRLAHAVGTLSSTHKEDSVIVTPGALNMLYSYGLFDETALKTLYAISKTQFNPLSEHDHVHSVPDMYQDVQLMLPSHILKLYGLLFVEIARVITQLS